VILSCFIQQDEPDGGFLGKGFLGWGVRNRMEVGLGRKATLGSGWQIIGQCFMERLRLGKRTVGAQRHYLAL
jgi:hypothetical protein